LATVAALLLVPATQAFAASTGKITIEGSGSGEVSSVGSAAEGSPPIQCVYNSPGPATGVCEDEMSGEPESPASGLGLYAVPSAGSEFVGWVYEAEFPSRIYFSGCETTNETCIMATFAGAEVPITAIFEKEGPVGPTNKRTLTVTKSGTPNSAGTVSSKPKGIKCASACSKAEASLYKNTPVTLTAVATTGSTFAGWSGGGCSGTGTCTVTMSEAQTVNAEFAGASKEVPNPQLLTFTKAGSGFGTVKATGLTCEADCTATNVSYTGGAGKKGPALVVLTAVKALGSEFNGWSGACSGTGTCEVTMSEAKSVTAEFTALPKNTLTVLKSGTPNSAGTVSSKPKGIKCASACSSATASYSEDSSVTLTAVATTGSTFAGWSGGGCSGTGTCTVSMSAAKTVTAEFSGASKEVANPQLLTFTKAGSGYGTVKATGLTCEPACTGTSVAYTGGAGKKGPAVVTLTAVSAPGSKPVAWSGCEAETESTCTVTMSAAKEVTATFDELE
jgi:hypothetical protein